MADMNKAAERLEELARLKGERELTELEREEVVRLRRIVRINELSALKRERALTAEEASEREILRKEFLAEFRKSFQQELENTYVEYPDGSRVKLSERRGGK